MEALAGDILDNVDGTVMSKKVVLNGAGVAWAYTRDKIVEFIFVFVFFITAPYQQTPVLGNPVSARRGVTQTKQKNNHKRNDENKQTKRKRNGNKPGVEFINAQKYHLRTQTHGDMLAETEKRSSEQRYSRAKIPWATDILCICKKQMNIQPARDCLLKDCLLTFQKTVFQKIIFQ